MKNPKLILIALLLSVFSVKAQEASVSNVLNLRTAKHSGQIIEQNKLVGYFIFYTKQSKQISYSTIDTRNKKKKEELCGYVILMKRMK
jgi:phosphate starvation-inducible membrane PsiE